MLFSKKAAFFLFLPILLVVAAGADETWQPVPPEEIKMTAERLVPGAPAIFLYRQVDRDDVTLKQYDFRRIKILTEEGRRYANIEVPFVKGAENIRDIQARVIHLDGSILPFNGKVYEKTIVKSRDLKYLAKTFTLPDVQVGSIIEYKYTRESFPTSISRWVLNDELFTKHAQFSLKRNPAVALTRSWPAGLPAGTSPPTEDGGIIRMEIFNVPAFEPEDYMPPADQVMYRVEFVYTNNRETDPAQFWKRFAKGEFLYVDEFSKGRKGIDTAVAATVTPGETAEAKLQKIYARVQQIRNLSFEHGRTEQEWKREKLKDINNAEDILKRGYGNAFDITWLFLAMVKAAGLEAYPLLLPTRDRYFFDPKLMNSYQLNTNAVMVKVNGNDLFFDPGMPFVPYGMLPWHETAVQALRLEKDGGTWVTIPLPTAAESRVDRRADLKLNESGDLEGKLRVTYNGLEAVWRRGQARDDDDTTRNKFLEDEIKSAIPVPGEVTLVNKPDWTSSSREMVAEFELKVPGWAAAAGRRQLLPIGLFSATEKHTFEHDKRIYPIYFRFPYQLNDDINVEVPLGWAVDSLPEAMDTGGKVCTYKLKVENSDGTLRWHRQLTVGMLMLEAKYYPSLQYFFQRVRTGDGQQAVYLPK